MRRIPETTDVLALYEVDVDADGDLEGYRRAAPLHARLAGRTAS